MPKPAGRLDGRVAVITGGASGMGRATVLRFLDEGACVVVADLNEGTGKETLELAAKKGRPRASASCAPTCPAKPTSRP